MREKATQGRGGLGVIGIQTWGIFLDAYREMNARRMFWIVMGLSGGVILIFATIGATEDGLTFLGNRITPAGMMAGTAWYKWAFSNFVIGLYLTWVATVLALISTAGIFPEFIIGGAIDLYLSKPIGRARWFLTKYVSGLLFAALQVTVFTVGSFLVLGIRGHSWMPSVLLGIPIVLVFFSYLYGMCVFFGMVTRSTMAALLLTILAWCCIFGIDLGGRIADHYARPRPMEQRVEEREVARLDGEIAGLEKEGAATNPEALESLRAERRFHAARAAEAGAPQGWARTLQPVIFGIKTVIPKTRETVNLLDRYLLPDRDLQRMSGDGGAMVEELDPERQRSVWWIVGTSLGFELVCVVAAGWIFMRRDF